MNTQIKPTPFVKYDQSAGKVLTAVVNLDQSSVVNRNRDFEIPLKSKLLEIESRIKSEEELKQYLYCADLIRQFIKSYRPRAKSVVVFSQANGRVTTRELKVVLDTDVCWQDLPHIQPLIEAADEFEELLIVLMDGRHARFMTSLLGEMTEYPEFLNPYPTAHTQAPGNDKTKSQPTFHQKADEHERHYLKSVAKTASTIAETRSINRIVLAGNRGPSSLSDFRT